jgi:hypothetical protein
MGLIGTLSGYTVKRSVAGIGAVALIIGEKIMRGREATTAIILTLAPRGVTTTRPDHLLLTGLYATRENPWGHARPDLSS